MLDIKRILLPCENCFPYKYRVSNRYLILDGNRVRIYYIIFPRWIAFPEISILKILKVRALVFLFSCEFLVVTLLILRG